jgi:hypothetical protein
MAFVKTSLPNYVEQHNSELRAATVLAAKSSDRWHLMPNVKGPTTLNNMANNIVFQDGDACGFSASGNTTLTQRTLTPGAVKVNMEWCDKDLLKTYAEYEVNFGSGRTKLPFEEQIMGDIIAQIGYELEKALWQGNSISGTGNLAFFDGLTTIINGDLASIPSAQKLTASQADTIYDRIMDLWEAIPSEVQDKSSIYMSYANFNALVRKLMEINLYHYKFDDNDSKSIVLPGTNMNVIGAPGLVGINEIYSLVDDEVYYGFDNSGDESDYKLWFSDDNDTFRVKVSFNAGINYRFVNHICVGNPYA